MKGFVIVDRIPETCYDCQFDYDCLNGCMASDWVHQSRIGRPDNCPIKPIPQKKNAMSLLYNYGWNDCIDEILGGDDE